MRLYVFVSVDCLSESYEISWSFWIGRLQDKKQSVGFWDDLDVHGNGIHEFHLLWE